MIIYAGRYNETEVLSGPEKVAKRIFHLQAENNKTIFLQYFFDGRKYNLWTKLFGKKILIIDDKSIIITLGIFRILFTLIQVRPKIIHLITFERFAILLYLYKIFSKVKYIYNVHGVVTFANYELKNVPILLKLKDKWCEKIYFKYSDMIIFPSSISIELAKKYFNFDEKKIRIVPHGCDKIFYKQNKIIQDGSEFKVVIQSDKIGFENVTIFLKNCLKKLGNNIKLILIGNYDSYLLIKNFYSDASHTNKKDTFGFSKFLGDTQAFLSIAKYDTFSISALEAMAAGVIVIVTKETGISEYIENGVNGFIVDFGDSKNLAEHINLLKNDKNLRICISEKARKIYDKLKWENIYLQYLDLYMFES